MMLREPKSGPGDLVENLGPAAVVIMVVSYALVSRYPIFILVFSAGCLLASFCAWLIGSVPFRIAEGLWGADCLPALLDKAYRLTSPAAPALREQGLLTARDPVLRCRHRRHRLTGKHALRHSDLVAIETFQTSTMMFEISI